MLCETCGTEYEGNFCPECGTPAPKEVVCRHCGHAFIGNFCPQCGHEHILTLEERVHQIRAKNGALLDYDLLYQAGSEHVALRFLLDKYTYYSDAEIREFVRYFESISPIMVWYKKKRPHPLRSLAQLRAIASAGGDASRRIQRNRRLGVSCCPKCGSTSLSASKSGFSAGKALVGAALLGDAGVAAGAIGSNKLYVTCLTCGHKWRG